MHINSILAVVATILATASAAALPATTSELEASGAKCNKPLVRKEWRTMSASEKTKYILAVKCLTLKPSKLKSAYPAAKTRWDDLVSTHQANTPEIHFGSQFLPWHRLFLHQYEQIIRDECFYSGAVPYWDVSIDQSTAGIAASPVFDTVLGFGGDGVNDPENPPPADSKGGGCIQSGPFKDTKINIGYLTNTWTLPAWEAHTMEKDTFEEFAPFVEGDIDFVNNFGIHNSGHGVVGGDMIDMYISTGDPTFYLVHGNVDRIWTQWQAAKKERLFDVGGALAPRDGNSLGWVDPPAGNLTLDRELSLGALTGGAKVRVEQILDTKGSMPKGGKGKGLLCYEYA